MTLALTHLRITKETSTAQYKSIQSAFIAHKWAEAHNVLTISLIKLSMCRLLFT